MTEPEEVRTARVTMTFDVPASVSEETAEGIAMHLIHQFGANVKTHIDPAPSEEVRPCCVDVCDHREGCMVDKYFKPAPSEEVREPDEVCQWSIGTAPSQPTPEARANEPFTPFGEGVYDLHTVLNRMIVGHDHLTFTSPDGATLTLSRHDKPSFQNFSGTFMAALDPAPTTDKDAG